MNTALIEALNISKSFKDVHAVKDVSISIGRGEFVALLGPNGAGKTTMVEMIEGIQRPDKGFIRINGKPWKGNEDEHHRILGISLQETKFIDKLTVTETLILFARMYGAGNDKVKKIITLIGLEDKKKAYAVNLSGGQRQKLALGIALINDPKMLLLDEPTTGLDPNARREIWEILMNLKHQENTSMILTTHYMEEAEFLCDRIIIMDKGNILAQGTLEKLLETNSSVEIIEYSLEKDIVLEQLPASEFLLNTTFDEKEKKGVLHVSSIVNYLPLFLNHAKQQKVTLRSLECRKMTLDDLFTKMTGRRLKD